MRAKSTISALRRQRDRAETSDLLRVYGELLNPHQHECITGFSEGKTFSQMGRELGVSRQAVHEAVRAVQRQLRWYEEKLGLLELQTKPKSTKAPKAAVPQAPDPGRISEAIERLRLVSEFVVEQQVIYSSSWIASELQDIIDHLKGKAPAPSPARARRGAKSRPSA